MRLLNFFLLLVLLTIVLFYNFGLTDIKDPQLASNLQQHLLKEQRKQSVKQLNHSFDNDSLGKIMSRAASVLTTDVTILNSRVSRPLFDSKTNTEVVVYCRYFAENSSDQTREQTKYLRFGRDLQGQWSFTRETDMTGFFRRFISID